MRQGGMKPKGHSSGTYWVRANAKTGENKTKNILKNENVSDALDDLSSDHATKISNYLGNVAWDSWWRSYIDLLYGVNNIDY